MRRFLVGLCCVVVGLQVLVAVPVAICLALGLYFGGDLLGPLRVEFRITSNEEAKAATAEEQVAETELDDPILAARAEHGSLLAGTMLGEGITPADEQREFVAAIRQAADDALELSLTPVNSLPLELASPAERMAPDHAATTPADGVDQFVVAQLYAMADSDERAGVHARADQWRGLARTIAGEMAGAPAWGANGPAAAEDENQRLAERQ